MARVIRQLDDEALEKPFNKDQLFRLLQYMKPYKKKVAASLFLMLIAAVCSLVSPYLTSRAIGELEKQVFDYMPHLIITMLVVALIGVLCTRYRVRWMDSAGKAALAKLREDLFSHIQSMSFSFFDTRSAGKLLVRVINDVNSLNDLFTNGIVNVLIDCVTLVILLVIMFAVNWKLTLIALCIVPMLIFLMFKVKRIMRLRWQKVRMKSSTMNGYLHESLTGMRITESFVREDENAETFRNVNTELRTNWMKAVTVSNFFSHALDLTGTIGTVLVYIFGVRFMQNDGLLLADLMLMIWYLGRFWGPLNTLSNFYNNLLTASASMERIFEIMDTQSDIQDEEDAQPLPPIEGRVSFDHVTFSYDGEKVVLKDVSFDIEQGKTIALVGPTGAGKSTVVNLISRFYDPTHSS